MEVDLRAKLATDVLSQIFESNHTIEKIVFCGRQDTIALWTRNERCDYLVYFQHIKIAIYNKNRQDCRYRKSIEPKSLVELVLFHYIRLCLYVKKPIWKLW